MTKYHYFVSYTWQDVRGDPKFGNTEATTSTPIDNMEVLGGIAAGIKRNLGRIMPEGNDVVILDFYLLQRETQ